MEGMSRSKEQKYTCTLQCHVKEILKTATAGSLHLGTRKQDHPSYLLCLSFLKYSVNFSSTG